MAFLFYELSVSSAGQPVVSVVSTGALGNLCSLYESVILVIKVLVIRDIVLVIRVIVLVLELFL